MARCVTESLGSVRCSSGKTQAGGLKQLASHGAGGRARRPPDTVSRIVAYLDWRSVLFFARFDGVNEVRIFVCIRRSRETRKPIAGRFDSALGSSY